MKKSKSKNSTVGISYNGLLYSVSELHEQARHQSARSVNSILTATYWEIGRKIVKFEQSGEQRAQYGKALLKKLSIDLMSRFGRGFSERNLEKYRLFYLSWRNPPILSADFPNTEISPTVSAKLEKDSIVQTSSAEPDIFQTLSGKSDSIGNKGIYQTPSGNSDISATPSRKSFLSDLAQAFPLPWSHYVRLLSVSNLEARAFYESEAIRGGWSVRQAAKKDWIFLEWLFKAR